MTYKKLFYQASIGNNGTGSLLVLCAGSIWNNAANWPDNGCPGVGEDLRMKILINFLGWCLMKSILSFLL